MALIMYPRRRLSLPLRLSLLYLRKLLIRPLSLRKNLAHPLGLRRSLFHPLSLARLLGLRKNLARLLSQIGRASCRERVSFAV